MVILHHPNLEDVSIEQVLYALSDPTRFAIFLRLYDSEELNCKDFEDLAKKNNLSHHFKVMRENGITKVRPEGRCRFISLRCQELNAAFPAIIKNLYQVGKKGQSK